MLTLLHRLFYGCGWGCGGGGGCGECASRERSPFHLTVWWEGGYYNQIRSILPYIPPIVLAWVECLHTVLKYHRSATPCIWIMMQTGKEVTCMIKTHTRTHAHSEVLILHTYPFPTLSRGAVVAVTKCTPSGHHSNWVESLAWEREGWGWLVQKCGIHKDSPPAFWLVLDSPCPTSPNKLTKRSFIACHLVLYTLGD